MENEKSDQTQIEILRKEKAYPILQSFENWLDGNYAQVLPKSLIGQAIAYTYTIYPRLVRYVIDGRYRLDNNLVENGVRPLALGRLCAAQHKEGKITFSVEIMRRHAERQSYTLCWEHAKLTT